LGYSTFVRRLAILLLPLAAAAQDVREFAKRVTEFTLDNGLHFIVVERHEAPVISFHTYVNAGSVFDPSGKTGIAHMFEHMAFKGTEQIGTTDWAAEKKALQEVEDAYDRLEDERRKAGRADAAKISVYEAQLKLAIQRANVFVRPNALPATIELNGGVGLNATTGVDATEYFYSLPSNRIELWFLLESERFRQPVFREFYKERDVVLEEYRMRIESNPQGKLMQTFLATAFAAHPYRVSGAGWPSDIQNLRVRDAERFFRTYYTPSNITLAMAGDVDPAEAKRLAAKYFATIASGPPPPLLTTREPRQEGPKQAVVDLESEPVLYIGYKRPGQHDADDAVFDVLGGIAGGGRTGLLYKTLVRDQRVALAAGVDPTFPGGRFDALFVFFVGPSRGSTVEENEKQLDALLDGLKKTPPDEQTLKRVRTVVRAGLIRRLASNASLAGMLASAHAEWGDWRKVFTSLDDIDKVSAADVQRVARKYFVPEGRTTAFLRRPARQAAGARAR
jgi:predicted Zn-dependent peptidase